jgi:O-antigen ligase
VGRVGLAENTLLGALLLAPWYLGCAPDVARYLLVSLLFLAVSSALAWPAPSAGHLVLPAVALLTLGMLELAAGSTVAPVWTIEAVLMQAAMLSVLAFVTSRASDPECAVRLSAAVLSVGLAQGAYGAYAWSVGASRIYGLARPDVTMPFGSFINHNHFAGFVEMPALLAFGMAAGHARRARQLTPTSIGLAGVGLALAATHLASRSRGGLVALAAGVLFCAAVTGVYWRAGDSAPARTRRLGIAALVAVLVLGFALTVVSSPARRHLATLLAPSGDSSGSYRIDTARATLRLFAERPLLGAGMGAYEDAVSKHKRGHGDVRTTHAESDALEWLAESGVVGLAALGWLTGVLIRRFGLRLVEGRDAFRKGIAIGAASGAFALAVHSLFDFNLRIPSNALLFVVLLGLAAAQAGGGEPELASSRSGRRAAAALLAALAAASLWRAHGAYLFERSQATHDPNARIEQLDRVVGAHPYLAEAWRERGLAWRELGTPPSALRGWRLRRAADDLSHAVSLRPSWGAARVDRGWTLAMLGDFEGASRDIEDGKRLDPTHAGIELVERAFRSRETGRAQR